MPKIVSDIKSTKLDSKSCICRLSRLFRSKAHLTAPSQNLESITIEAGDYRLESNGPYIRVITVSTIQAPNLD